MRIPNRSRSARQFNNSTSIPEAISLRVLKIVLLLVVLWSPLFTQLAFAQTQPPDSSILIDTLETSDLPAHSLSFRFLSPTTPLASPLTIDQVSVLENGTDLDLDQLTGTYVGIHLAIAVNPNYDLGIADNQGVTKLNRAITAIDQIGISLQTSPNNRFSLFINPNVASPDLASFPALQDALAGYKENIRVMSSSLDSLDQAVEHLTNLEADNEKALLYVTPALQNQVMDRFEQITARVSQAGIRFHVWLVANSTYTQTAVGQKMAAAISKAGGYLFIHNGVADFPDPSSLIQGLGYRYDALYTSQIRSSGSQQLVISVKPASAPETASTPFTFDLEVEPIATDFLNLPETLTITKHENSGVTPDSLPIEVALSFPDHHPREIRSVELWINGIQSQVNTQPPYGSFVIDLSRYLDATQLEVEARVSDSFDLVGTSDPQRVSITWDETEILQAKRQQSWSKVLIALPIVALFVGLLLIRPWQKSKKKQSSQDTLPDEPSPVTPTNQNYLATFSRMESNTTPSPVKPHEITQQITLIGKDPDRAQWVIEDEALEPVHAELRILPEGQARITDFNTAAGTWVNFEKVSARGVELKQGDLVKLGSKLYRFNPRQK